ncbi:MAG: phytanoyl-CoA dioxygenase family protein [Gammaproteobacteria bacterium]|nr:phytanoyl-CoA dioxygenase family protein [Gammaproteobacteria bacterium]
MRAINLDDFKASMAHAQCEAPLANDVQKGIPIYAIDDAELLANRQAYLSEWAQVLMHGAGVLVLKGAYADTSSIDLATKVFNQIIADEKAGGSTGADHFAKAGANDRIWNSLQKLCLCAPDVFARYHANIAIDMVCEAWVGPYYQMTAQVNLVRPGGKAQSPHRDYHLGFQTNEEAARFPDHIHALSPALTLQGAIAHVDMSIESGPTKLLPRSQRYPEGYLAWRDAAFIDYFEANYVQLPLNKGDAVFFNPALLHAAGDNVSTDIERMVNLLQVSSAMGRAMESVDRTAMCNALYPALSALDLDEPALNAVIAASAEGYSFPTNLDRDPPVGGLVPKTQQDLLKQALAEQLEPDAFYEQLKALAERRKA